MQPVHTKIVVTTEPDPINLYDLHDMYDTILLKDETNPPDEINFARWGNIGLQAARTLCATAILNINSDVRLADDAIPEMKRVMDSYGLSMVGADLFDAFKRKDVVTYHGDEAPWHTHRISAACFMTPGDLTFMMDERYRWYWEVNDLEYECRRRSGVGVACRAKGWQPPDTPLSPRMQAYAAEGKEMFREKWGHVPHE